MIGYLAFAIIAVYATRTDAEAVLKCCHAGINGHIVADTDDLCKFHICDNSRFSSQNCAPGGSLPSDFINNATGACSVLAAPENCPRAIPLTVQDNCAAAVTEAPITRECYSCEYNLDGSGGFLPCGQLDNSTQAALVGRAPCTDQCFSKISNGGSRLIRGCSVGWTLDRSVQCEVQSGETWKFCDTDLCNTETDPCP